MASFRKLKSGKWQAQIRRVGHRPIVDTFPTKATAERWAKQVETDISNGVFKDSQKAASALFRDLLARYDAEIIETKQSKRHSKLVVRELSERWPYESILAIDSDAVLDLMRDIKKRELSRDTADKYLMVIAGVFTAAAALWSLPVNNPVPEVKTRLRMLRLFAAPNRRDRRLTVGEYAAIVDWSPNKGSLAREVFLFAIETALRRGELAALDWSDINKRDRVLDVRASKTDYKTGERGRRIPLSGLALSILDRLPRNISGSVFGMKPDSITQAFRRMGDELGFEDLRLHDLRHEAASRFFEMGLTIEEVASITGHQDWSSLKVYTHPRAETIADKLAK